MFSKLYWHSIVGIICLSTLCNPIFREKFVSINCRAELANSARSMSDWAGGIGQFRPAKNQFRLAIF